LCSAYGDRGRRRGEAGLGVRGQPAAEKVAIGVEDGKEQRPQGADLQLTNRGRGRDRPARVTSCERDECLDTIGAACAILEASHAATAIEERQKFGQRAAIRVGDDIFAQCVRVAASVHACADVLYAAAGSAGLAISEGELATLELR
jgi:hypothetical protein